MSGKWGFLFRYSKRGSQADRKLQGVTDRGGLKGVGAGDPGGYGMTGRRGAGKLKRDFGLGGRAGNKFSC